MSPNVSAARFTQQDPIGLAGGLNAYGLAGGDPANYSDPLGLCPDCRQKDGSWVNPTGGSVRGCDAKGCGAFGAPRDGGGSDHLGMDFVATLAQNVKAVTSGSVTDIVEVYRDPAKRGYTQIEIERTDGQVVKELYVASAPGVVVGTPVTAGQIIGTQQPLQRIYPGITEHVHVQIQQRRNGRPYNPETVIPGSIP